MIYTNTGTISIEYFAIPLFVLAISLQIGMELIVRQIEKTSDVGIGYGHGQLEFELWIYAETQTMDNSSNYAEIMAPTKLAQKFHSDRCA